MVNIFIAFMLPREASSDMYKVADDVNELFKPDGKEEKFFHCNLLFIGRVAEDYIPFIQEKMKSIAAVESQSQSTSMTSAISTAQRKTE